jgi:hypothetical protein
LGKHAAAERTQRRAIELCRDRRGRQLMMNNLAVCLGALGRWGEAEAIHRDVAEALGRDLGAERAETLVCVGNVAECLAQREDFAASDALYASTLPALRRVLGPRHPATLRAARSRGPGRKKGRTARRKN